MSDVDRLLKQIVDNMEWPDGWINRCSYCHRAWPYENGHDDDCLYVQTVRIIAERDDHAS